MNFIINIKYYTCVASVVFILMIDNNCKAQKSLVPNGSFEQYTTCPSAITLQDYINSKPDYWYKPDEGGGVL